MKKTIRLLMVCLLTSLFAGTIMADNTVIVGPEFNEIPFSVTDFSACTDELVDWQLLITEFVYVHISGHGNNQKGHVVRHFNWTGTALGQTTGYMWETHGGGKDTLNLDLVDGTPFREVFLENAILQPVTEGAPRMKFEARVRIKDGVFDAFSFEFTCLGN